MIFTTSTGKTLDLDNIKYELIARDKTKGDYWLIFTDDSELYITIAEYEEIRKAFSTRWKNHRQES